MEKYIGSVKINLETGQLFSLSMNKATEIKCPYDIAKAYETLCTFEYLKDNYTNDDDTLWQVARETRELIREIDYPLDENEAIEKVCKSLNITLWEE